MEVIPLLFHEIYGRYFQAVSAILAQAVAGELTERTLTDIACTMAFAESGLVIPPALTSGTWPLLT